jgi:hypothetical protein
VLADIVGEAISERLDLQRLSNRIQDEQHHRAMLLGLPAGGST